MDINTVVDELPYTMFTDIEIRFTEKALSTYEKFDSVYFSVGMWGTMLNKVDKYKYVGSAIYPFTKSELDTLHITLTKNLWSTKEELDELLKNHDQISKPVHCFNLSKYNYSNQLLLMTKYEKAIFILHS